MTTLTEEEKRKILEEEKYRAQMRAEYGNSGAPKKRSGAGCGPILVGIFVVGALAAAVLAAINPKEQLRDVRKDSDSKQSIVTSCGKVGGWDDFPSVELQPLVDAEKIASSTYTELLSELGNPTMVALDQPPTYSRASWEKPKVEIYVEFLTPESPLVYVSFKLEEAISNPKEKLALLGVEPMSDPDFKIWDWKVKAKRNKGLPICGVTQFDWAPYKTWDALTVFFCPCEDRGFEPEDVVFARD